MMSELHSGGSLMTYAKRTLPAGGTLRPTCLHWGPGPYRFWHFVGQPDSSGLKPCDDRSTNAKHCFNDSPRHAASSVQAPNPSSANRLSNNFRRVSGVVAVGGLFPRCIPFTQWLKRRHVADACLEVPRPDDTLDNAWSKHLRD